MPKPDQWTDYLNAVAGLPPRETCLLALDRFDREGAAADRLAVDLGCGEGRDTMEMVRRGWRVMANDTSEDALARVAERLAEADRAGISSGAAARVELNHEPFTTLALPRCRFVNASFSIPHCLGHEFGPMWSRIVGAIEPGGRFAGQLFGVRDSWTGATDSVPRTFHSRGEVERLLQAFEVEHLEEIERPGKNALGEAKYWHVFHIVARKR